MTIILIIKKSDVHTSINGMNYQVTFDNGLVLNLTKAAIEELYNDMKGLDAAFKYQHDGKTQSEFYNVTDVDV